MAKSEYQKWLEKPVDERRRQGRCPETFTNERWVLTLWSNPAMLLDAKVIFEAGQRAAINSARRRSQAGTQ